MRPPARSWYSSRAGVTGLVLAAWSSSTPREGRAGAGSPRPAVALTDVSELAVRRINVVGTVVLALGTLALAALAAAQKRSPELAPPVPEF